MKRCNLMLAIAGLLLFLGAAGFRYVLVRAAYEHEETIVTGGCRTPVTVIEDSGPIASYNIVFHGLIANRGIMTPVGRALQRSYAKVFVVDLPGHGDNTDSFSFHRAEYCAEQLVRGLAARKEIELRRTVLVGHSMGGAIAIRVGARMPQVAGVVALSPPPFRVPAWMPANILPYEEPQRVPSNLLILFAQADLPFSGAMATEYVARHGGPRAAAGDFSAKRALRQATIPLRSHTGMMFSDTTWALVHPWIANSVGAAKPPTEYRAPVVLHVWAGLLGLLLMTPLAADALTRPARRRGKSSPGAAILTGETGAAPAKGAWKLWLLAGMLSVALLSFGVPLRFLRLYNGDYFASALATCGVVLLALMYQRQRARGAAIALNANSLAIASAMASGFAFLLAFGAWLDASIYDAWLNPARWQRSPALLLCALPYTLAEELALGPIPSGDGRAGWRVTISRVLRTLALRAVLWLCFLFAIFIFQSGQILLVLTLLYLIAFTIAQRLGSDAIRRRTGSAAAAACFSAILAAWLLALFPLL